MRVKFTEKTVHVLTVTMKLFFNLTYYCFMILTFHELWNEMILTIFPEQPYLCHL